MCALVDASQSVLLDRFCQLLDDGDAAVVDPVGQHLPHVLKRVKGKGYDAGRSDAEGRVDVEVLSGREVVVIMECFLKELLYPKDECLAGEYPQHVRQIALPECSHSFFLLHPQQAVPQSLVPLLEVALLHQLGHDLHPKPDQVHGVGQRDRPRDEQPREEGGFDALQRRFFCNSHCADSYQYIKLICGIDLPEQATPILSPFCAAFPVVMPGSGQVGDHVWVV